MQPFNIYVEGARDELDAKLRGALDATFPAGTDDGDAQATTEKIIGWCDELIDSGAFGDNVTQWAVNFGGASTDGRTTPDAVLDIIQFNLRATGRGELPSGGEPAGQV